MADRFVSYLRVSTPKQAISGLGIEAQRAAITEFLRFRGGELVQEFVEAESGAADDRAQLRRALDACRARRATLLVAKLDRLARSVAFVSAVMDSDVPLIAADNPHASRLVLHMLAAVAEFEREQISSRTKAALAAAKARGVKLGANGARLAERAKAEAGAYAESLRAEVSAARSAGRRTLHEIAADLNERGITSREGGKWHPASVRRLLRRLSLAGQKAA